jgi:MFS family permease
MNSEDRKTMLVTASTHGLVHLLMLVFISTNISIAKEMNLNLFQIGNLGTLSFLAFGLGAIPAGIMIDKIGSRKALFITLLGLGISTIFVGLSTSPLMFGFSIFFLGIFASFYHPAGLSYISKNISQRARAMGFHGMGGNVGVALSPVCATYLASLYSWRLSYIAFSIPAFILALIVLFSTAIRKEEHYKQSTSINKIPEQNITFVKLIILVYALQIVNAFIYTGSLIFLPTYLGQRISLGFLKQSSLIEGGLISSVALLVGVFGQYVSGELSQKYKAEKILLIIMIIGIPFLFLIAQTQNIILIISIFSFAFCHFFFQPLGNEMVAKYSSTKHRSRIYAISFTLSFSVGAMASSFAGFLAEYFDFSQIFIYLGFAWITMLIISLILFLYQRKVY